MNLDDYLQEARKRPEFQRAEERIKVRLDLSDAIIRARSYKGWSQSELAEKIGTKQASISRIESGLANPTLSIIQKLCSVLDISIIFSPTGQEAANKGLETRQIQSERKAVSSTTFVLAGWEEQSCNARWETGSSSDSGEERLEA